MNAATQARLEKLLDKTYRGETLRDYFVRINGLICGRVALTETHGKRKVNGCYPELKKPRTTYHLKLIDTENGGFLYFQIEKLIFDHTFENFVLLDS